MKKISLFVIGSAMMAGSVTSALSGTALPAKGLENYDIRSDTEPNGAIANTQTLAAARQLMATGRSNLLSRIADLRVDENSFGTGPEIVDVTGSTAALTEPSTEAHELLFRRFVVENAALYGLTTAQARQLQTVADYTNPAGNLSWVEYAQRINGIPVFQGYLRGVITNDGRLWRTTGALAAGLDYSRLPATAHLTPATAAMAAAKTIGVEVDAADLRTLSLESKNHMARLAPGPFTEEIKVELFYFPIEPGLATLAYSMVLWEPHDAYWVLVDANDGRLLWRKNITNDQTQSVTYSVYDDESPTPLSPSNALPGSGIQGIPTSRTTITNISELPAFDNLGWIADGAGNAVTTGNNVDAGLDIDGSNGVDANGRATGVGRVFDFPYAPGGTPGEEPPTGSNYRMGIVTNLFFWSNRYHDRLYQYGFTEQARNFQNNNFGRGGLGADFVRAEAQDSSGVNSANFGTPGDGSPPRMQMFIFNAPDPDRDTSIDGNVVLHELTHGTSNRLHANASGLATTMSGGMGEGWSDYYARCLLSSADEDVNGIYPMGGYVTLHFTRPSGTTGTDNYYYGIRRFPYAVKTTVGGPTALRPGQPHNPLTFADMDVALNFILDGAYDPSPSVIITPNESHRIGEIWCLMLLEMRARMITRLGWATGNDRALQIVTDGMKLDPANPTVIQGRNSILAADCAGFGGADEQDIWAGFATRGAGLSASTTGGTTLASDITEAFDVPNLNLNAVTFTDTDGNGNGFADPGETIALTVPLVNPFCGTPANTTTATVTGGGTGNYGTIAAGAVVSQVISYTVPANAPCGTLLTIPINIDSSLGPVIRSFTLLVGQPIIGFADAFDSVAAPALPAGWTTAHTGALADWVTSTTNPSNAPNDAFANEVTTVASSELVTPAIPISSGIAQLSFRNLYNLQASTTAPANALDGMVLEISIPSVAGGAFQDILAAGGTFAAGGNGYNKTISAASNPLTGRQCWSGLSGGTTAAPTYLTTTVILPASANGQSIRLKWRRGDDSSGVAAGQAGARIDDIKIATSFSCIPVGPTPTPGVTPTPTATTTPVVTPTPAPTPTVTPTPACIANPVVTTNADSGPGSLRQAISDACSGSTITFDMGQVVSPITLSSALEASGNLIINGPGAGLLTVSGNDSVAVFQTTLSSPTSVTLSGLSLVHGHSEQGGIFHSGSGTLNITRCVVGNNASTTQGGGVYNGGAGTINISDSTLNHNSAPSTGGGILNASSGTVSVTNSTVSNNSSFNIGSGGGISNSSNGTVNVINSTISGNSVGTLGATPQGGGIFNASSGTVLLTNSTIAHNLAEAGGGLSNLGGGSFQILNSIVALNGAQVGGPDLHGNFTTLGHNLIGTNAFSTGFTPGTGNPNGDLVGTEATPIDPFLGPLANNGGATLTHLLQTGSLAIDAGDNAAITNPPFSGPPFYDQRGTGFLRIVNTTVDIGSVEIGPPVVTPAKALNISTRLRVETGDNVGIGGFIITGSAPIQVLLRAIGPSLTQSGVPDALTDPVIELHGPGGFGTITNNNWRDTQEAAIIATGIPPTNNLESAIDTTLDPGAYTAIVRGNDNTSGVALVEVYNLSQAVPAQLANISTRGLVGTGNDVMIAGFILGEGNNTHILIRGIGLDPGLADPTLELRDSNGALLASNDDCGEGGPVPPLLGVPPVDPPNACIDALLPPGAFTAILAGKDNGTGIGLLEIYNLP